MAIWSIWPNNPAPGATSGDNVSASQWVSGLRFRTTQPGLLVGLRWYGVGTGARVINLYTNSGTLLATTNTGNTALGWTSSNFGTPVSIQACTTYVATCYSPTGALAYTNGGLASKTMNGPLIALADKFDGINAVYAANAGNVFPTTDITLSYNMWVDLLFEDSLPAPLVPRIAPGAMAAGPPGNVWIPPYMVRGNDPQPTPLVEVTTDPNAQLFLPPPDSGSNPGGWPSWWVFIPGFAFTATNWPITISASVGSSATALRATAKAINASQAAGVSLVKNAVKPVLASLAQTVSRTSAASKPIQATSSTSAQVSRASSKTLSSTVSTVLSLLRASTKSASTTSATSVTVRRSLAKSLTSTAIGSSSSIIKAIQKPINAAQSLNISIKRDSTKALSATSPTSPTVKRAATKSATTTQASTSSLASRVVGKVVTLTQGSTSTLSKRALAKTVSMTQVTAASVSRAATKSLSATQAQSSTVRRAAGKVISASSVVSAVLSMISNRKITITTQVATVPSIARALSKRVTATVGTTSTVRRAVAKTISAAQSASSSAVASRTFHVLITATQGITARLQLMPTIKLTTAALFRFLPEKAAVVREWDGTKWIVRRVFRKR